MVAGMANEIHVLFRGPLPKKAALARALRDLDFPVSVPKPTGSLERQKGFMPMRLHREDTGVEFDVFDGREAVEEVAGTDIDDVDPSFDRVASFRWGGDTNEMACGVCGAAALAGLVNGLVIDEYDSGLMPPNKAVAYAREAIADIKPPDNHFGTRPAHIKRYLKPLLKQRTDLVQIGYDLLIRPVRHLVRGVSFEHTSDKYVLRFWRYINALYAPRGGFAYGGVPYYVDYLCEVWQPHFQALLIERLPGDVLTELGAMSTLDDFLARAKNVGDTGSLRTLVLADRLDEAEAFVRKAEQNASSEDSVVRAKALRGFITRDIDAICAEAHAVEADAARKFKLTDLWEPSPFPVELPATQRPVRSAEPKFLTTPWPERPPGLLQPMPDQPGEVQYAKSTFGRDTKASLLVSLTCEQAKARHEHLEDYVLAARTSENGLVLLTRYCHMADRLNPAYDESRKRLSEVYFQLWAREHRVHAWFRPDDAGHVFRLRALNVYDDQSRLFHCSVADEIISLGGGPTRPPTDAERHLFTCPIPPFGEHNAIVAHVLTLLRIAGFGEVR